MGVWAGNRGFEFMSQSSERRKAHRAVIVAAKSWVGARVMSEWLSLGNEIAEIWIFGTTVRDFKRVSVSSLYPGWDAGRLVARHAIPIRECEKLTRWSGAVDRARSLRADTLLSVMTHEIVPEELLNFFGRRAINVHPSFLPYYKGRDPRPALLVAGKADEFGGISFHVLSREIDGGAIIGQRVVPFSSAGNYVTWDALQAEAAAAIVRLELAEYLDGKREAIPQQRGSGSYRKVAPDEFNIVASKHLSEVRRLCDLLGATGHLSVLKSQNLPGNCPIAALSRVLGAPSGQSPRLTARHIEMDLADARVRLKRRRLLYRLRHAFDKVRAIAKARAARRKQSWA